VYWDPNHEALWVALDDSSSIVEFKPNTEQRDDDEVPLLSEPFQAAPNVNISLETNVSHSAGPDVGVIVGDHIYQPIDNIINVINTNERRIVATWFLPFSGVAKGVSYDPINRSLLVGTGSDKAFIVSATDGSVLANISLPGAVDESVIAPRQRRAFIGDKAGYVDVLDLNSRELIQSVPTHPLAHTLTVKATDDYIKLWSYLDQVNEVDVFWASL